LDFYHILLIKSTTPPEL